MFLRIANVLLQSGSPVPEWIMKLPKPSKMKRRQMGKVKRADIVNKARNIGRSSAIKKRYVHDQVDPVRVISLSFIRDMIAGSKRRKANDKRAEHGSTSSQHDDGDKAGGDAQ